MNEKLDTTVSPNLLFRYSARLQQHRPRWTGRWIKLDQRFALPHWGQFDGQPTFADVRGCWHAEGLVFTVEVTGKKQKVRCNQSQLLQSDGLQIWIDTRDVHNVHRASRFCHWFLFLPTHGKTDVADPLGTMLRINRAREDSKTFQQFKPQVASDITADGYRLAVYLAGDALTGWNPNEHRRLGFQYAVIDSELGWQTLATDFRFPIAEDPSLWQTLELVE